MARYHVKADGSMGVCTAREGNCPFGGEEGTKHFGNESEARAYSEKIAAEASKSRGGFMKKNENGGQPPVPPSKGAGTSETGDNWPKYTGDFGKWNNVPATNYWRDVPGIDNDPSNPSTKIRSYVMDKMVQSGFGDGAKDNDFTHDGVGYIGSVSDFSDDYLGNWRSPDVDPNFDGGVGYTLPKIDFDDDDYYDDANDDLKITRPSFFGSITNPSQNGNYWDYANKSYHGMALSDDGKTLEVTDCWNYPYPDDDDYDGDDENIKRSLEGRKLFRETMEAHGITGKSDGYGAVDYTIDATDPKAIDNYFEAYKDFKNKFGEDNWKKGYYMEPDPSI